MKQLVYKLPLGKVNTERIELGLSDVEIVFLTKFSDVFQVLRSLVRRFGFSIVLVKMLAKLLLRRKLFYIVLIAQEIVNNGEVSFGYCNHYEIGMNDCIVGTIFSAAKFRGKGLAFIGLSSCIQYLRQYRSPENIFIDTSEDNLAMQKVIARVGFGDPVSTYERN